MKLFNQVKGPDDLIFYFLSLLYKKVCEVVLEKYDRPNFVLLAHNTNIRKVVLKCNCRPEEK
jgi:hypothetical protein